MQMQNNNFCNIFSKFAGNIGKYKNPVYSKIVLNNLTVSV